MKRIFWGIVTGGLVAADLHCKSYVEENFEKVKDKEVCDGKVELRKVHNKGIALGFGAKYPETVRLASGVVCGIIGIQALSMWKKDHCLWKKLGIALAFAGAISNTYDRFKRKYVVDYFGFKTKWEKLNRITFNLADMFIFLGSGILLVAEIFKHD